MFQFPCVCAWLRQSAAPQQSGCSRDLAVTSNRSWAYGLVLEDGRGAGMRFERTGPPGPMPFAGGAAATMRITAPARLLATWKMMDKNRDGRVSRTELILALRRDATLARLLPGVPERVRSRRAEISSKRFHATRPLKCGEFLSLQ